MGTFGESLKNKPTHTHTHTLTHADHNVTPPQDHELDFKMRREVVIETARVAFILVDNVQKCCFSRSHKVPPAPKMAQNTHVGLHNLIGVVLDYIFDEKSFTGDGIFQFIVSSTLL